MKDTFWVTIDLTGMRWSGIRRVFCSCRMRSGVWNEPSPLPLSRFAEKGKNCVGSLIQGLTPLAIDLPPLWG